MEDHTRPTLCIRLTILSGLGAGRSFEVQRFPVVLGRGAEADVQVPDDPEQPTLSRRHLRLSLGSGRLHAEDLSTNGTSRAGRLLPAGQAVPLGDSEELSLGSTRVLLETLRALPVAPPQAAPVVQEAECPRRSLEVRTLGGFEARLDGTPIPADAWDTRKPMLLLAYLAMGRAVTPEKACDDLWPDASGARQALQTTFSRLRRTFKRVGAADPVVLEGGLYRLEPGAWLDTAECERLYEQGGLQELRALYRGEFLPGFTEDWACSRRVSMNRLYLEAMAALGTRLGGVEARQLYLEVLEGDSLWEAGHLGLMGVLPRDEAVRHYHRYVALLKKGLDLGPSPEMVRLFESVRTL